MTVSGYEDRLRKSDWEVRAMRTHAEMLALGATMVGAFAKNKFVNTTEQEEGN